MITRLTAQWNADYERWRKRDLSARRYVYMWADGVYLQARVEDQSECLLVLIGATPEGRKELVGFQTGVREGAQSWRELLVGVERRGMKMRPILRLAMARSASGRRSMRSFPAPGHQRCWVHKTANVLNKVPLSVQANMKTDSREIYGAPTRSAAETAIDVFAEKYGASTQGGRLPDEGIKASPSRSRRASRQAYLLQQKSELMSRSSAFPINLGYLSHCVGKQRCARFSFLRATQAGGPSPQKNDTCCNKGTIAGSPRFSQEWELEFPPANRLFIPHCPVSDHFRT